MQEAEHWHLPILLAGPILRRAEPAEICIWIACSKPVSIKAEIFRLNDLTTSDIQTFLRNTMAIMVRKLKYQNQLESELLTHYGLDKDSTLG